ncbi:MAG: NFYB/HAP3 family transcription factor subunit [Candidatus Micrarchaeota archaeon]|nr:NFYB/HAP3 family transcription factor subunit [Candidatus Micrarchaeota archaeon]
MGKRGFSLYDIEQLMKDSGAEFISEDAVVDLEQELERMTEKIANRALSFAKHAGRNKLIKKSDILLTERE